MGEVGGRFFLDCLMIGSWMRFADFFMALNGKRI